MDRIEKAVQDVDDSDGHCTDLLACAADIHLAAARDAQPEPAAFARALFAREMDSDFETFHGAVIRYADVLGEAGLAEYRRLAAEAWEKHPSRSGPRRRRGTPGDDSFKLDILRDILDFFAEREDDAEARIALRAKDLSSQWRYVGLVNFCVGLGRDEDALRWAEEGLWLFEDEQRDERLVALVAELQAKAGRPDEAEALLWRVFEKQPGQELYRRLREAGGPAARDRALRFLEDRVRKARKPGWGFPADFFIGILIDESLHDAAWTAVRSYGASGSVKQRLAGATEATHRSDVLGVYAERVEDLVANGSRYEEAVRLVMRMGKLRDAAGQADYVAGLKARHGRKRNLMKLLG